MLTKKDSLLSVVTTTQLPEIAGKETKECFTSSRYIYRDKNFDFCLPANQSKAAACTVTTTVSSKTATFAEWARAVLGMSAHTSIETLVDILKGRRYIMTLPQIEIVEVTQGRGNFFFVENKNNGVSVVLTNCIQQLYVGIYRFDSSHRWPAGRLLVVPNMDTSKL